MNKRQRRAQATATDASLLLVQEALVQIRTMAYLRRCTTDLAGDDYHESIRLVADACENLPGYMRVSSPGSPEQGLQYAWDKSDAVQRSWLRAALVQHGIELTDLVSTLPGTAPEA